MLTPRRAPQIESIPYSVKVIGVASVIAAVLIWVVPSLFFDVPKAKVDQGTTLKGTVTRVLESSTEQGVDGPEVHQKLEVRVGTSLVTIDRSVSKLDPRGFDLNAGDKVLVSAPPAGSPNQNYFIEDLDRGSPMLIFVLVFAVLVIAIGRWQGVSSLFGMVASLLVILRFIVPGIMSGYDPVLISIVGAVVIMTLSLYLAHGVNQKTTTALAGTAIALALTAALSLIAVDLARLSGLADEQAATLNILTKGAINPQGLLLAGIIIGALGVLDDVTVAQAASVFELHDANAELTPMQLFGRAMNIGRDHIASTVNTLFLAYAGAALPLLIIFSLQTEPASTLVSREFLSTEIIRTLVGSIGIVASVPVTTGIAAWSLTPGSWFR